MKLTYDKPEAKLYDLYVDGRKLTDWVTADESTQEYELFAADVPWRGGGRIEDADNPTGYQTFTQTGKVEFKRNDVPDLPTPKMAKYASPGDYPDYLCLQTEPHRTLPRTAPKAILEKFGNSDGPLPKPRALRSIPSPDTLQEKWDQLSPEVQNFINERIPREPLLPLAVGFEEFRQRVRSGFQGTVSFTSDDGVAWLMSLPGEKSVWIKFEDTNRTAFGLALHMTRVEQEFEGEPRYFEITEPEWAWSHEWMDDGTHRRTMQLTSWGWKQKEGGQQLFQWLDYLNIHLRQHVGLPV